MVFGGMWKNSIQDHFINMVNAIVRLFNHTINRIGTIWFKIEIIANVILELLMREFLQFNALSMSSIK